MTETEKQDLWKRLMDEKAGLLEQSALATANGDAALHVTRRLCNVDLALSALKEARSIRDLLAKIEAVGEKV